MPRAFDIVKDGDQWVYETNSMLASDPDTGERTAAAAEADDLMAVLWRRAARHLELPAARTVLRAGGRGAAPSTATNRAVLRAVTAVGGWSSAVRS